MDNSRKLLPSLVGVSIDFSFRTKMVGASTIDQNIKAAQKRIEKDVETAHEVGGKLGLILLAEMTSYYASEIYYMAVRGSIHMRRLRPLVLEYMQKSVSERAEELKRELSRGYDTDRDVKITALRYFIQHYPGRLKEFKRLISREEFIIVA